MYVNENVIDGKEIDKHDEHFTPNCPNPYTKKYRKKFGVCGEYLNKDNWQRGAYILDAKYKKLENDQKLYHQYFENFDIAKFMQRYFIPENKLDLESLTSKLQIGNLDKQIQFDDVYFDVEEFCKYFPQGDYVLETKAIFENACTQIIPVFDGKYQNNINCHKWAVINAYKIDPVEVV